MAKFRDLLKALLINEFDKTVERGGRPDREAQGYRRAGRVGRAHALNDTAMAIVAKEDGQS